MKSNAPGPSLWTDISLKQEIRFVRETYVVPPAKLNPMTRRKMSFKGLIQAVIITDLRQEDTFEPLFRSAA